MTVPLLLDFDGTDDLVWQPVPVDAANGLLDRNHYLGPLRSGAVYSFGGTIRGEVVAAQLWRYPTSASLPNDGSWLELSRWCLTARSGKNAGSRMHAAFLRWLRSRATPATTRVGDLVRVVPVDPSAAKVTTLVSYSDPSAGHTGALYRSCNWWWAPTWHRLRPPPSGNGTWDGETVQSVKDRWVYPVRRDPRRESILRFDDPTCERILDELRAVRS